MNWQPLVDIATARNRPPGVSQKWQPRAKRQFSIGPAQADTKAPQQRPPVNYIEKAVMEIEVDEDFLKYNPGSPGAVERGCTCPQAENNFGRGRSKYGVVKPSFATDPYCAIHGLEVLLGIKLD
jgi:hypothetical protein